MAFRNAKWWVSLVDTSALIAGPAVLRLLLYDIPNWVGFIVVDGGLSVACSGSSQRRAEPLLYKR